MSRKSSEPTILKKADPFLHGCRLTLKIGTSNNRDKEHSLVVRAVLEGQVGEIVVGLPPAQGREAVVVV